MAFSVAPLAHQFLPKQKDSTFCTNALKTRPIAIGSVIFRSWAKLRYSQATTQLGPVLTEFQVGGLAGHNAHTLLLNFQETMEREDFPIAASWDFAKAFDSIDWETAVPLLGRIGLPPKVVACLGDMWRHQRRWISLGGLCAPGTRFLVAKQYFKGTLSGPSP